MILDDRQGRRLILAAAAVGLIARLAFGFLYWTGKPLTHDEREYLELAASLQIGRGFTYLGPAEGTSPQFGRAPGYPLFLAAIGALLAWLFVGRKDVPVVKPARVSPVVRAASH